MSDKMVPISISKLYTLMMNEYEVTGSILGISKELFFDPKQYSNLGFYRYGQYLESPLGVAAGPQTQLAQNIIAAWLVGARYMELKTVQTLDELHVSKPCIDMEDEGFNCEWSQELKLDQSYMEYLKAFILIHLLQEELGLQNEKRLFGTIFNMSCGYNMEGILNPNVQQFLNKMEDSTQERDQLVSELAKVAPKVKKLKIPARISNNLTLSTMHGCPPDEIEKIALYLLSVKKYHTTVKLNPTLNGPTALRSIINERLGFNNVVIPNIAFEHDLKYPDALRIIKNLKEKADELGLHFSLKLTNTLESMNNKSYFDKSNEMMYMSGRALHPLAINLALKLQKDFEAKLDLTFCAGVDAFNVAETLSLGMRPVTVCTDLLKPGGYGRLAQYFTNIVSYMNKKQVNSIEELFALHQERLVPSLEKYLAKVLESPRYHKKSFPWKNIKTERLLSPFDCIAAPCVKSCPTSQHVPSYMYLTSLGLYEEALNVIRFNNPFPNTTGMACDHICEDKCTRMNYDDTLLIRDIKRFVSSKESNLEKLSPKRELAQRIGIIGGGPSGMSAAYFLALEGFQVEIFEAKNIVGGMITHALPDFRTIKERVERDITRIRDLGVTIHENHPISTVEEFEELHARFDYLYIATGAEHSKKLGIPGEDAKGVVGFLAFLEDIKLKKLTTLPKRVAVIGGGNSAIDAVRSAKRLMPPGGEVILIYRRTIADMPASREEIKELLDEKIKVLELAAPVSITSSDGVVKSIRVQQMQLALADASGRRGVVPVEGQYQDIEVDLIVRAVGQDIGAQFLPSRIKRERGAVVTNALHLTTDPKVIAGGDVVRGPASIIKGIADGKSAAYYITKKAGLPHPYVELTQKDISLLELRNLRAERISGGKLPHLDLSARANFDLVVKDLSEEDALTESSRCLYCDELCETCVTVCPNRANLTYTIKPATYLGTDVLIKGEDLITSEPYYFGITQEYQVLNLGDFCNECGNCALFCPTNGRPYETKPKLYFSKESFKAEKKNAFFLQQDGERTILFAKLSKKRRYKVIYNPARESFAVDNGKVKFFVHRKFLNLSRIHSVQGDSNIRFSDMVILQTLLKGLRSAKFDSL